jgi:hypothetical protein
VIPGGPTLEVYEDGDKIASFEDGSTTLPCFLNGGSELITSDGAGAYKYDVDSGEKVESLDVAAGNAALSLSPNGTVCIPSPLNTTFVDPDSFEEISSVEAGSANLRTTVFASENNAIRTGDESVVSMNPQTGEIRWQQKGLYGSRVGSDGAATDGEVYVLGDSAGRTHFFDVTDGSKQGRVDTGNKPSVSSPVIDNNGGVYTLTDRITKIDEDLNEDWSSPIDGLGNSSVGMDNAIIVSTTESVQMFDRQTGEEIDTVLEDGGAKTLGMPRNGKLPVMTVDNESYFEVPIERGQPSGTQPPEDTGFDIARAVSPNEVAPGEKVTVTTELSGVSGPVSTSSSYEPQFDEAAVQSVTVDGDPANPVLSEATPNGSTVTLSDVGTEATVTTIEELTAPQETDLTYEITGEATSGETTTEFNPLSIPVTEPQSVVERYDTDNDGNISITELGNAGKEFALGNITITELGKVGQAFARSN